MSLEKSARSDSAQCAHATVLKYCTPDTHSAPLSSSPPASETWQTTTDYLLDANNVGWAFFFLPLSSFLLLRHSASWPFDGVPFFSVCRSRDLMKGGENASNRCSTCLRDAICKPE